MRRILSITITFFLIVLLLSCSKLVEENQIDFDLLASEDILQSGDFGKSKVKKVTDRLEFEEMWAMYGLETTMPNVNFDEKAVYFIVVKGSGSCPYTVENTDISKDRGSFMVILSSSNGECTTDEVARLLVIQVDKNKLEEIDNVKIIK